jgi:hypothetical protein
VRTTGDRRNTLASLVQAAVATIVIFVISSIVAKVADPSYLQNDAAQYLSTASNLSSGFGASTDVLFYDQQFESGSLPDVQTIWPPGYPFLVAVAMKLGFELTEAAVFVGCVCLLLTALGIHRLLRGLDVSSGYALVGSIVWIVFAPIWTETIGGMSGSTAVMLSVYSMLFYLKSNSARVESWRSLLFLGLAGIIGGLSFATHYSFAFYLIALALVFFVSLRTLNWTDRAKRTITLGLATCLVVVPILFRNYILTGYLTRNVQGEFGYALEALIYKLVFSLAKLTGIRPVMPVLSLISGAALFAILVIVGSSVIRNQEKKSLFQGLALPLTFCAVGFVAFVAPSFLLDSGWPIVERYFAYLTPAFLVASISVAYRIRMEKGVLGLSPRPVVMGLLLGLVVLSQGQSFLQLPNNNVARMRNATIEKLLDTRMSDKTIRQFLALNISRSHPLYSNEPQGMWHATHLPVLGVASRKYSLTGWDLVATRQLIQKFKIEYVIFMPAFIDVDDHEWSNHPFYAALKKGLVPEWLEPVFVDKGIQLYRVRQYSEDAIARVDRRLLYPGVAQVHWSQSLILR